MRACLVAIAVLLAAPSSAHGADLDLAGWKLLGKRTVEGADDGTIVLRNYDGNLDELAIVVEGGPLRITQVLVDHTNLADLRFDLPHRFDDGAPFVLLDLSDNQDTLEAVTLVVDTVGSAATVRIYGRDRRKPEVLAPEYTAPKEPGGQRLGGVDLDGSKPGAITFLERGPRTKLAFVASHDLDLLALRFDTANGPWIPYLTMKFREGARVLELELDRGVDIASVEFEYTVIGAPKARLDVHVGMPDEHHPESAVIAIAAPLPAPAAGTHHTATEVVATVETTQAAEPAPTRHVLAPSTPKPKARAASPDPLSSMEGWTLLGEDEVDLIDDYIEIQKQKATWDKIAIVADGDAIRVEAVELTLAGKSKKKQQPKVQREEVAQDFAGDDRVRVIEIAGSRRAVSKVRLQYKKHRLDASSRVKIYAR